MCPILPLEQVCQFVEAFACKAKDGPVIHRLGAKSFVKIDGACVPVQHRPFQAAATALDRQLGQKGQHLPADTLSAEFGLDEEIFQVDAGLSQKGRKVMKKQGESCRRVQPYWAIRTSATRRLPNSEHRRLSISVVTSWDSFSNSASARIKPRISSASVSSAKRKEISGRLVFMVAATSYSSFFLAGFAR